MDSRFIKIDVKKILWNWWEGKNGKILEFPQTLDGFPEPPQGAVTYHSAIPCCVYHEVFDAKTKKQLAIGSSQYSADLVLAMVKSGRYDLFDAIWICAMACERCTNGLAHYYNLAWGYPIGGKEWKNTNTTCMFCNHYKKPIRERIMAKIKKATKWIQKEYIADLPIGIAESCQTEAEPDRTVKPPEYERLD